MSDDPMELFELLDKLAPFTRRGGGVRWRVETLLEIERWTLSKLSIRAGDHVVLRGVRERLRPGDGWWGYRDLLVDGATGVVDGVHFNRYVPTRWQAETIIDGDPEHTFWIPIDRLVVADRALEDA